MAKALQQWLDEDVAPLRERSVQWLSEQHFFRDPIRPIYSDSRLFFSPADGVILYQHVVGPDDCVVEIKGRRYTLRQALRDEHYDRDSVVVGIFMTFYDVHINRVPYAGRLSYRLLPPIASLNCPMLAVEKGLVDDLHIRLGDADYLFNNERMLNRIHARELDHTYYVLQIADYDVDAIMPFELKQNWPCSQNQRFSQIRYGSQVDLVIPLSRRWDFAFVQEPGVHVEAGIDPLVRVRAT